MSSSKLPKLPSTKELLAHPRVKSIIEQLSQSTVATRAAEFYEDLRNKVSERASSFELPSLPNLAEQFARRLLGESGGSLAAINASGIVVGGQFPTPLPEAAIHAMLSVAGDFRTSEDAFQAGLQRQFSALAGAEDALLTNSYESALYLTIAALAAHGDLHVMDSSHDCPHDWQRLASNCGAALRSGLPGPDSTENVLTIRCPSLPGPVSREGQGEGEQVVNPSPVVDLAPLAGFCDPEKHELPSVPTIQSRIHGGANLVLVSGDGLIGGPSCGIIAGERTLVERIRSHSLASTLAVAELDALALKATLDLYESPEGVAFSVPVWQLLSTPLNNLQLRAGRLAQLIAAGDKVEHAEPRQFQSPWIACRGETLLTDTWGIAISMSHGDAAEQVEGLRNRSLPVFCSADPSDLIVDLRTVFPRWDQAVVSAFA